MPLETIPENASPSTGIMTMLPTHRIKMNASSVPSSVLRKFFFIGVITILFIMGFYVFKHYGHIGHHFRRKHHAAKPHHSAEGTNGKEDKIQEAINANLDQLKSRAGNIYVDNEKEALHHFDSGHHDDDHEDDDYDDDDYDDDDDSHDDDDDDDEDKPESAAPK